MGKINPSFAALIAILLLLSLIPSCYQPQVQKTQISGIYHLVKKDETVQMIAQAYGIPLPKLVEANDIADIKQVKAGAILFIPAANRMIDHIAKETKENAAIKVKDNNSNAEPVKELSGNKQAKEAKEGKENPGSPVIKFNIHALHIAQYAPMQLLSPATDEKRIALQNPQNTKNPDTKIAPVVKTPPTEEKVIADKNKFVWPVKGSVKTQFGFQPNKTFHNWIKIISVPGAKVKASAPGTVIFSSQLKNYGETVIIRHKGNYATVYTHLKKRYVRMDQNVKKGEAIALLGEKDDTGNVYMNFEVRFKGKACNPMLFLP